MSQDHPNEHEEPSALQGYFDWQVTTLMLAYDLRNPIDRKDAQGAMQRRKHVEREVSEMTLALIPDVYKTDPSLTWPPSVMMAITRATLAKSAEIGGIIPTPDA